MIPRFWKRIFWGLLVGAAAALFPGAVFIFALILATRCAIVRWSHPSDRAFLAGLFISAFLVRAVLSVALDLGSCIVE